MPNHNPVLKLNKGLVSGVLDSTLLQPGQSPNLKNIMKYGDYIGQRPGRIAYGTVSGAILGYYHFKVGTDYNKFLLFTTTGIYYRTSTGWTSVTGSALTGTIDNFIDACTVYDSITGTPYVVFTNGKDNIRKYTGSGNTADMSGWTSYKARFLRYFNGYLIGAHLTDAGTRHPYRLKCAHTDSPNDTTSINSKTFNLTQDRNMSDIMGVEYIGKYLAFYKTDCIYVGYLGSSQNIFQFDVPVHNIGLRASRGFAIDNKKQHWFVGNDDIYLWPDAGAQPQGVASRRIKEALFERTAPEYLARAIAVYHRQYNQVRFYVPESYYLNTVYVVDLNDETVTFWKEEVNNVTGVGTYLQDNITTIDDLSGTIDDLSGTIDELSGALQSNFPIVIEGDKDGNSSYISDTVRNDKNITIQSFYETGDDIFQVDGVPFSEDRIGGMRFEAKGPQATGDKLYLYYSTDEGTTWTQITTGVYDDGTTWNDYVSLTNAWRFYEGHFEVYASKIRYKFENLINDSAWFLRKTDTVNEDGEVIASAA